MHFGVTTHLDAIRKALGALDGRQILDIGCGASELPGELAMLGADCTGIDPFMPARDWQTEGAGRWRIVPARAEALPLPDASIDVVIFVYSLHHVPGAAMPGTLAETHRVLRPGGRLYVAEPCVSGDFNSLISTFHDESAVRATAQDALRDALPLFATHHARAYTSQRRYDSFEAFAANMTANTRFNDYSAADVVAPHVRERFTELVARNGGLFEQPVKVDLFVRA